jgi:hypothetical protein
MAIYQILYWKDIPAQVRVFEGRKAISRQMPDRFQLEIDQIAMEEGLTGSDDYLDQWDWTEKRERPGNSEEVLNALLQELEAEYDNRSR